MDTGALAEAIRSHRIIEVSYARDPRDAIRLVHPHALFRTGNGGLCIDALQVAGETQSGRLPAWRQFAVIQIRDVRVLRARFEPARDFDPKSGKYHHGLIAVV